MIHQLKTQYDQFNDWHSENPLKGELVIGLWTATVFTIVFYIEGYTITFSLIASISISILYIAVALLIRGVALLTRRAS